MVAVDWGHMDKIVLDLENCYGIGKLSCKLDFSVERIHTIYAPNGFMKSSLARSLIDLSRNEDSKDEMFPERPSRRDVTDGQGHPIEASRVLVIQPYIEDHSPSQISTLLVAPDIKKKYDDAVSEIERLKNDLLATLRKRAGLGKVFEPEAEICTAFGIEGLLEGIDLLDQAANQSDQDDLSSINYKLLFGERVRKFLEDSESLEHLEKYIQKYDSLVSASPILTRQFTHTKARSLYKSLSSSNFFQAEHWVVLNDAGEEVEVRKPSEFEERVERELRRVLADPELKELFEALDNRLSNNAELQEFREYLRERPELILRLGDIQLLKKQVWSSLLALEAAALNALKVQYQTSRRVIELAVKAANEQATDWAEVVERFNERFRVPFRLRVENQADVILREEAPNVVFDFHDPDGAVPTDRNAMSSVLSQGERRALYLLQVLFELRIKEKEGSATLLVIDDIADSFDYRNKYAIIEYLSDLKSSANFRLLIMSHNYDFHRSVAGRLNVPRQNRWFAVRDGRSVTLEIEKYQKKNPLSLWREKPNDLILYMASIPLVRNLSEYTGHQDVFNVLTKVLHVKGRTRELKFEDLDVEYSKLVNGFAPPSHPPRSDLVWDALMKCANEIAAESAEYADLEFKIVLSIAIRLLAEEFMLEQLGPQISVSEFSSHQTRGLLSVLISECPHMRREIEIIERVQLMTPENIHLNSFMFEPILDLGMTELRALYQEVKSLRADGAPEFLGGSSTAHSLRVNSDEVPV